MILRLPWTKSWMSQSWHFIRKHMGDRVKWVAVLRVAIGNENPDNAKTTLCLGLFVMLLQILDNEKLWWIMGSTPVFVQHRLVNWMNNFYFWIKFNVIICYIKNSNPPHFLIPAICCCCWNYFHYLGHCHPHQCFHCLNCSWNLHFHLVYSGLQLHFHNHQYLCHYELLFLVPFSLELYVLMTTVYEFFWSHGNCFRIGPQISIRYWRMLVTWGGPSYSHYHCPSIDGAWCISFSWCWHVVLLCLF